MLSLKCYHPLLCEFPILFLTVKVKLGHKFSQFIHKFNILILKCWSVAVYIYKFFPILKKKRWEIGIFEKLRLQFSPTSLKSLKIEIFVPLPSYLLKVRVVFQYDDMWRWRGQFMIKLAVIKKKMFSPAIFT